MSRGNEAFAVMALRVQECERRLAVSEGRVAALEFAVKALIASAANPSPVPLRWAQVMPIIVEDHVPTRAGHDEDFLQGLRHGLGFVTEQIEALASLGGGLYQRPST